MALIQEGKGMTIRLATPLPPTTTTTTPVPIAQSDGAAGVWPAGSCWCPGGQGCVCAAAPPWPVLHGRSAAPAIAVLGLQSAVTLHPAHPTAAEHTGMIVMFQSISSYSPLRLLLFILGIHIRYSGLLI